MNIYYYPGMASLEKCNGICNTLDDLSGRICVLNKIEHENLNVFNILSQV